MVSSLPLLSCEASVSEENPDRKKNEKATIADSDYLLINLCDTNTEREQLTIIKNLNNLLKDLKGFMIKMWFLQEILS